MLYSCSAVDRHLYEYMLLITHIWTLFHVCLLVVLLTCFVFTVNGDYNNKMLIAFKILAIISRYLICKEIVRMCDYL